MSMELDIITKNDSVALQHLAHCVGWNFTRDQVNLYIASAEALFGHRVEGRLVSSAGIYLYGPDLASLGVVMVHPDFQRRSLGKAVVMRCLRETERTGTPVILVSTAQGVPLYTSLGFRTIGEIHRFERVETPHQLAGHSFAGMHRVTQHDLGDLIAIDQAVIGARREALYKGLISHVEFGLLLRDSRNSVLGFGLAVRRNNLLVIGPLIAPRYDAAAILVAAVVSNWPGPVRMDVPGHQTRFMTELTRFGFKEKMVSPLMVLNARALPGQRHHLFAIIDPAFG